MSTETKIRPWTDDEVGYIASTMDRDCTELSEELGRSVYAIRAKRVQVKRGWQRKKGDAWSDEEIETLRSGAHLTADQLAQKLPGRTMESVRNKRRILGMHADGRNRSPERIGGRPLIAKTCKSCGLLLPSDWFAWSSKARAWAAWCKKCKSDKKVRHADRVDLEAQRYRHSTKQALTLPHAENSGQEYTEADHKVLANPDMTVFEKALALKRTYFAVVGALNASGYKSHVGLGEPERDQWMIDNPNAASIEEITAMLKQAEPATPTRPDFEWDD